MTTESQAFKIIDLLTEIRDSVRKTEPTTVNVTGGRFEEAVAFAKDLKTKLEEPEPLADWERELMEQSEPVEDVVNEPSHYTAYPVEVIELTEHLNFCRGNAVKYIARAGLKDPAKEIEDLEKARWYIDRELERVSA